ncbi:ribosome biogenesis protein [Pseudozyma hubeiensis SY62]|uniref:Ribosome biogenesis protein n=1 Tax=Pseudozyma hubeiensis (strain SY62) TaxID=1305764 RepID=R9NZ40_PSEHS|nr:ribosome biogenesis protein [Pseudozyma hubeiensis SY62]GAC93937.1 ribosome biogenesis protein [Pseudozyma hubeiensis SY62]
MCRVSEKQSGLALGLRFRLEADQLSANLALRRLTAEEWDLVGAHQTKQTPTISQPLLSKRQASSDMATLLHLLPPQDAGSGYKLSVLFCMNDVAAMHIALIRSLDLRRVSGASTHDEGLHRTNVELFATTSGGDRLLLIRRRYGTQTLLDTPTVSVEEETGRFTGGHSDKSLVTQRGKSFTQDKRGLKLSNACATWQRTEFDCSITETHDSFAASSKDSYRLYSALCRRIEEARNGVGDRKQFCSAIGNHVHHTDPVFSLVRPGFAADWHPKAFAVFLSSLERQSTLAANRLDDNDHERSIPLTMPDKTNTLQLSSALRRHLRSFIRRRQPELSVGTWRPLSLRHLHLAESPTQSSHEHCSTTSVFIKTFVRHSAAPIFLLKRGSGNTRASAKVRKSRRKLNRIEQASCVFPKRSE